MNKHILRLKTPDLERAMAAIEESLRSPDVLALNALLEDLSAAALTKAESDFADDLRIRAKRLVAETVPDSSVDSAAREILSELHWAARRRQTNAL